MVIYFLKLHFFFKKNEISHQSISIEKDRLEKQLLEDTSTYNMEIKSLRDELKSGLEVCLKQEEDISDLKRELSVL